MCISMSYHYSKYEFVGPESELERYRFRSASSSSLLVCFDGIFRRREFPSGAESDFRRNIPIGPNSRYQTRYAQVGCSARARARPRAREPPGSEYRMFEYHSGGSSISPQTESRINRIDS